MRNIAIAALGAILAAAGNALANINATGTIAQNSPGNYTITLTNTGSESIGTFWYSWTPVPFYDFMTSNPTNISSSLNWFAINEHSGPGDGYSIFYYTFGSGITPGSSATFSFSSPDSLASLTGPSSFYSFENTGTSFIYTGVESGDDAQITVTAAPEPAGVGLLGAAGAIALGRRRRNV